MSAHLAQAVSHLDNSACLTCHSDSDQVARLALAAHRPLRDLQAYTTSVETEGPQWSDLPVASTTSVRMTADQDVLDASLRDLGYRLLNLPERDQAAASDVIAAYIDLVEATRPASSTQVNAAGPAVSSTGTFTGAATRQHAVWRLSDLEEWVRVLEHRASPVQWTVPDDSPAPVMAAAALAATTSAPLPVLNATPVQLDVVLVSSWAQLDSPHLGLPYEIIFGTQRRGPPADAALVSIANPVLDMGDCRYAASSLPFFWRLFVQWLPLPAAEQNVWCTVTSFPLTRRGFYVS